jgi:hypothetical protein
MHGHNDTTPERYGWWINKLEPLGPSVNKINEFNAEANPQPDGD